MHEDNDNYPIWLKQRAVDKDSIDVYTNKQVITLIQTFIVIVYERIIIMNANNENRNALTIAKADNIVYDLNGKATAPLTIDNAFSALKSIERTVNKSDLTRIAIMSAILESCGSDTKLIAKTKKLLATEYGFKSTSAVDKYYRVATTFLSIDKTAILSAKETNETALTDTVDKDGKKFEIAVNTSCVHGWTDKFGFEFNTAQLQEFLWLKNPEGEIDVEKLIELIDDGKIKASMSASGKNGIRDLIKSLKPNTDGTDETEGNTDGTDGTDGNTDGTDGTDNKPITVQYEPSSNKSKAIAIQTILNSIEDDKFTTNKMVIPFIEFLGEYIKNSK